MREIDMDGPGDFSDLFKSRFEVTPPHKSQVQRFKYEKPQIGSNRSRAAVKLALTDLVYGVVQVFNSGGENVRHSHAGMDGFWMVLGGCARFYIGTDEAGFDVGKHEGLVVPRDVKYWFESVGDEALEILQVDAFHPAIRNVVDIDGDHKELAARTAKTLVHYDARTQAVEA